jgi:hypothetical protein
LTEAITEPLSVAGARRPVTEVVTIGSPDPLVRLTNPVSARVTVSVAIAPVEWTVAGLPIQVRNAPRPVQLLTGEVTVHVRGPRDARDTTPGHYDASVDVTGLQPGEFDLPVHVVPPARVGVESVNPPMVRVRIR